MKEYFAILDNLRRRYQSDSLYLRKRFDSKILPKLQQVVDNYYNELFEKEVKIMEKYSNFDMQVLGPILASIVSIFEGHEFAYQDVIVTGEKDVNGYYSSTNYLMIVDSRQWQANYSNNDIIDNLSLNGQAFIIKKNHIFSRTKKMEKSSFEYEEKFYDIVNYYINGEGDVKPLLKDNQFPYLKEFIDYVIIYRMNNNLGNTKKETLLTLRKEFIASHIDQIKQKVGEYDKLKEADIQKQIAELTDRLNGQFAEDKRTRKLLLEKILDK